MTVAFDAFSNVAAGTGNLSWTHTPVGTPRAVIVQVSQHVGSTDEISSVTYGSETMTEVAGSPNTHTSAETNTIYTFFLGTSIPTGAQTVTVTVSGASNKRAGAITLTASSDCEVIDSDGTIDSDSQENPLVTLSLASRTSFATIVFFSGHVDPSLITPLTNWTDRLEHDWGSAVSGWYTYDTIGSADVTAGWNQSADDAVAIALAVSEVVPSGDEGPIKAPIFSQVFEVISDMIDWPWSRDKKRLGRR